jgi:hypothetical protein
MGAAHPASWRPLSAQDKSSCRASLLFYLQRRKLIYKDNFKDSRAAARAEVTLRNIKRDWMPRD